MNKTECRDKKLVVEALSGYKIKESAWRQLFSRPRKFNNIRRTKKNLLKAEYWRAARKFYGVRFEMTEKELYYHPLSKNQRFMERLYYRARLWAMIARVMNKKDKEQQPCQK